VTTERLGLTQLTAAIGRPLALAKGLDGRLDEARAEMEKALALWRDNKILEGLGRASWARLLTWSGDLDAAEREARAAEPPLSLTPPLRAMALAALAEVLLLRGDAARALEAAREAHEALERLGAMGDGEALTRLVWAEALRATGDLRGARDAILKARDRLLARADRIIDGATRARFLEGVPENARTIALARLLAER
jgi:tetratricopeptide (TPR) repeat protein